MENELLRARAEKPGPLARRRSRDGRRDLSPVIWPADGVKRGPRPGTRPIIVYACPAPGEAWRTERPDGRRGPKPASSDVDLPAAIRRDLEALAWSGEGHRKVWLRASVITASGSAVSRRITRESLAPHRRRPVQRSTTTARLPPRPNVMWGADAPSSRR